MKVSIELTVDEFCSIIGKEGGDTVLNGCSFRKIGSKEVIEKQDQEVRDGKCQSGFLFWKLPIGVEDGELVGHMNIIQVKIVKAHTVENLPPKEEMFKLFGRLGKVT